MTNKSQQSKSARDWRARWLVENYGLFVSPGKWPSATFKVTIKKKKKIANNSFIDHRNDVEMFKTSGSWFQLENVLLYIIIHSKYFPILTG